MALAVGLDPFKDVSIHVDADVPLEAVPFDSTEKDERADGLEE